MAAIGEGSGYDVVLEVKSAGDTLEHAFAAAHDNRMLATAKYLAHQVGAILILRLEAVGCPEGAGFAVVCANEDFGPGLAVGAAW